MRRAFIHYLLLFAAGVFVLGASFWAVGLSFAVFGDWGFLALPFAFIAAFLYAARRWPDLVPANPPGADAEASGSELEPVYFGLGPDEVERFRRGGDLPRWLRIGKFALPAAIALYWVAKWITFFFKMWPHISYSWDEAISFLFAIGVWVGGFASIGVIACEALAWLLRLGWRSDTPYARYRLYRRACVRAGSIAQ